MLTDEQLKRYIRSGEGIINFAEEQYVLPGGKCIELLEHQKRVLKDVFTKDEGGKFKYRTIVYSTPKKGGKTELSGLVALWYALTQEPNNEIYVATNSYVQSIERCFARAERVLRDSGDLREYAQVGKDEIKFENGTTIKALASNYSSVAGSLVGLSLFDELAFYTQEADRRLYEELTPIEVPSRENSLRWITSTAGFLNESQLLYELYERAVLNGERLYDDLPVYVDGDLYFYYETDPQKVPWISNKYLESQRKLLRPNQFLRLWYNEWVASETAFIGIDEWKACERASLRPFSPARGVVVGCDLATQRDASALVAVIRIRDRIRVVAHKLFEPTPGEPVNLEDVERELRSWGRKFKIHCIYFDPFQARLLISRLRNSFGRDTIQELPQTGDKLEKCANELFSAVREKRLEIYPSEQFREHIQNCVASETLRGGYRIAKLKGRRNDLISALSFACYGAAEIQRPLANEWGITHVTCVNPYHPIRRVVSSAPKAFVAGCPLRGGVGSYECELHCKAFFQAWQAIRSHPEFKYYSTKTESVAQFAKKMGALDAGATWAFSAKKPGGLGFDLRGGLRATYRNVLPVGNPNFKLEAVEGD